MSILSDYVETVFDLELKVKTLQGKLFLEEDSRNAWNLSAERAHKELAALKEMHQSTMKAFSECLECLKICKPDYHPDSPMGVWEKFIKANLTQDAGEKEESNTLTTKG